MLVRYLASNSPKLHNLPSYIGILKKLRVKSFAYKGIAINLTFPINFYDDMNSIRTAKLIVPQSFKILGEQVKTYSRITHHFFKNGQMCFLSVMPEYGSMHETTTWSFNSPPPRTIDVALQKVAFEDGRVKHFKISKDISLKRTLSIGHVKRYNISAHSVIKFDREFPVEFTINSGDQLNLSKKTTLSWNGKYYSKEKVCKVEEVTTQYRF